MISSIISSAPQRGVEGSGHRLNPLIKATCYRRSFHCWLDWLE